MTEANLLEGRLYPKLSQIRDVSVAIATDLAQFVFKEGLASAYPEPEDKEAYIRSFIYSAEYKCFEPDTWELSNN